MKKIFLSIITVITCANASAQIVKVTDAEGTVHEFENPQSVLFCPSENGDPATGSKIKSYTVVQDMTMKKLGMVPFKYSLTWDGDILSQLVNEEEEESIVYTKTDNGVKFSGSLTSDGSENMEYDLVVNGKKADYFTWTNRERKYVFNYSGSTFTGLLRERNGVQNQEYGYPKFTFDSNGRITELDNGTGHDIITFKYEGDAKQTNDIVNIPLTIGHVFKQIDNQWAPFSAMIMGLTGTLSGDLPSSAEMDYGSETGKETKLSLSLSYTMTTDGRVQKVNISGASFFGAPQSVEFEY